MDSEVNEYTQILNLSPCCDGLKMYDAGSPLETECLKPRSET